MYRIPMIRLLLALLGLAAAVVMWAGPDRASRVARFVLDECSRPYRERVPPAPVSDAPRLGPADGWLVDLTATERPDGRLELRLDLRYEGPRSWGGWVELWPDVFLSRHLHATHDGVPCLRNRRDTYRERHTSLSLSGHQISQSFETSIVCPVDHYLVLSRCGEYRFWFAETYTRMSDGWKGQVVSNTIVMTVDKDGRRAVRSEP